MAEGGMPESSSLGSKPASSLERAGDRLRLTVELRPGETTIVSWKKLLREATARKPDGSDPSASRPHSEVNQQLVAQSLPSPSAMATSKQPAESEGKGSEGQAGSNRLASVIEKIERLYAGDGSSEEEDVILDEVPDDDEYDTEDSFIDDAELDDYFKIDKSTLKHDGFFVNRGKLESIEPSMSTDQQPKKRRRKDVTKAQDGTDGRSTNKLVKTGNKSRKVPSLTERSSAKQLHSVAALNILSADADSLKKKGLDTGIAAVSVDAIRQDKDSDNQRDQVLSSQNHNNKQKVSSELQGSSAQRSNDRSSHGTKTHSGKQLNSAGELDQTIQRKEKVGIVERFDLNVPASKDSLQVKKAAVRPRKEGSSVRSRVTMLEKAIRELEKIVAESRPPSTEVQDNDNSSQAVKRRLPADIKQKLAKVARLAHDSYGKIPKDVINRLMSIVGHLMQLRTLKRNLKVMANLGLSAKQEKDDRLQKIKQEVAEMVRQHISYIETKVEQQARNSDDFQEAGPEDKEALKRKCSMNDALENKICDLYDLYIERLEEHSGPPVRRLYEELAALWPSGVMDTDGIKRAIYKAKNRRKALSARRKDQEKIKKKALGPKAEDSVRGEAINVHSSLHIHDRLLSESSDGTSPLMAKPVPSTAAPQAATRLPAPFSSDRSTASDAAQTDPLPKKEVKRKPNTETVEAESRLEKQKQERVKGSSSSTASDAAQTDPLPKKKVKRKPNTETVEAESRLEKPAVSQVEEKSKHQKHMPGPLPKPNLQPDVPSGSENPG